jgi:hypothetical protein
MRMTWQNGSVLLVMGIMLLGCNKVEKRQPSPSDYVLTVEGMH